MRSCLSILLLAISIHCCAQRLLPVFSKQLSPAVTDFTADNLGNIYLVSSTGQVKKLNSRGDSISVYNDVRKYGALYTVDASNPFKILLYYKDFSTIVALDRLLNIINIIDLRRANIFQASVAAISYDNNVWVYDDQDSRLKKIDDHGNVLLASTDMRQALDNPPVATALFDRDGQLYVYDSLKGLFVFDYYGALKNNLQLLHVKDLQVINKNTITGHDQQSLLVYKPSTLQSSTLAFPNLSGMAKVLFSGQLVYALSITHQLLVYKVNE